MPPHILPVSIGVVLLLASSAATAQTPYRAGAGLSLGLFHPVDADLDPSAAAGVMGRLQARGGWGPTIGFNWMSLDLQEDGFGRIGRLRVRPVMAGIAYTVAGNRLSASVSLVGGYAFNRLRVDEEPRQAITAFDARVRNSPTLRPGLSVWHELTPRLGLNAFGGYLVHRPMLQMTGPELAANRRLNADTLLVSAGLAVWVF